MSLTTKDIEQIKVALQPSFDAIERRFVGVDGRFVGLEQKFDDLDEKFDKRFDAVQEDVDVLARITKNQFDQVLGQLGVISEDVAVVKDMVKDHSFRVARLEYRTSS